MQFNAIREVLQPLYKQADDEKYHLPRTMAIQYASILKERLWQHRNTEFDTEPPESNVSVHHLIWMCDQVITRAGYVPKEMSATKLHRWIGYIQGVMVARGFTTVERERAEYKELKVKILEEMSEQKMEVAD